MVALFGWALHFRPWEVFLAGTALCGCSVSMAFTAWWHFPHQGLAPKRGLLLWMVGLEVVAVFSIALADADLQHGTRGGAILNLIGIAVTVLLVALFADHLTRQLAWLMNYTSRWRVHFIALLVFSVAALGERLGFSAPKTAFLLGFFVSRGTHHGLELEHHLRPIGEKLLVPIFFVGLGALVSPAVLLTRTGLWAVLAAALLLLFRQALYRRFWQKPFSSTGSAFFLLCPNLTIAAVAAQSLQGQKDGASSHVFPWLLLTSVLMSVASVFLLPPAQLDDGPLTEAQVRHAERLERENAEKPSPSSPPPPPSPAPASGGVVPPPLPVPHV